MSLLQSIGIDGLKVRHDLNVFVETGTGKGDGLAYVQEFCFERYYSVELMKVLYEFSRERFKQNPSITLLNMKSEDGIVEICSKLKPEDRVLFWMDAHFPGADFNLAQYDSEPNPDIRIPMERELRKLVTVRDVSRDVIICDDLFLYEDGPFEVGNWPLRERCGGNGVEFLHDIFSRTHLIIKTYSGTGYIMMIPKVIR